MALGFNWVIIILLWFEYLFFVLVISSVYILVVLMFGEIDVGFDVNCLLMVDY